MSWFTPYFVFTAAFTADVVQGFGERLVATDQSFLEGSCKVPFELSSKFIEPL